MQSYKIFMTGANGLIGHHVANQLIEGGHQVTALIHQRKERLSEKINCVNGDINCIEHLTKLISDHDMVIHLAAQYKIGAYQRKAMFASNVLATQSILQASKNLNLKKFVHVSSTAALGVTYNQIGNESNKHQGNFRSYYEETKQISHGIVVEYIKKGMPISIAIPGGAFGLGDESALGKLVEQYCQKKIKLQVATQSLFQLCHAQRIADGIIKVLFLGEIGESYILAGETFSLPNIFAQMAHITKYPLPPAIMPEKLKKIVLLGKILKSFGIHPPISQEELNYFDGSNYVYSAQKAITLLGWHPGKPLDDFKEYILQTLENLISKN